LQKHSTERKKAFEEFCKILEDRAGIEDTYIKNMEKLLTNLENLNFKG
jgi:Fes/CIP4 homology domain.